MGLLSKIKLFATDFDNSLVLHKGANPPLKSTWRAIHRALGTEEQSRKLFDAYHRGEFDLLAWCEKDLEILKASNLTEQQFKGIFMEHMALMPGADQLFYQLDKRGIKTAIISGGLENTYKIFSEKFKLKIDYPRMAHRYNFGPTGKLEGGTFSNFDYEGKVHALQEICSSLRIELKDCAFVGDEINDIPIFKKVGVPIAINTTNKELISHAKIVLKNGDLSELLSHF